MNTLKNHDVIKDNDESRTGLERRQFSYTAYIPERRSDRKIEEKDWSEETLKID